MTETETKRVYVFCPESPEATVWLGRAVRFKAGRLVSDTDGLTHADLDYFTKEMKKALDINRVPHYVVWDGDIGDPQLRILLESRVTEVAMHGPGSSEPQQVIRDVSIRMATMLADPDSGAGELVKLSQSSQQAILGRLSQTVNRGPLHGLPVEVQPGGVPAGGPSQATLAREQEIIQQAASEQSQETTETPGPEASGTKWSE